MQMILLESYLYDYSKMYGLEVMCIKVEYPLDYLCKFTVSAFCISDINYSLEKLNISKKSFFLLISHFNKTIDKKPSTATYIPLLKPFSLLKPFPSELLLRMKPPPRLLLLKLLCPPLLFI